MGLLVILSAKQLGVERIIAMSRHEARQKLAREFGATDIVPERGDEGVARIMDMTRGIGVDATLECVGTQQSMKQAIDCTRPGGTVGYVGVPHGVELDGAELFFKHVRIFGGSAPVRRFLPELIDQVLSGQSEPGKVFDDLRTGRRAAQRSHRRRLPRQVRGQPLSRLDDQRPRSRRHSEDHATRKPAGESIMSTNKEPSPVRKSLGQLAPKLVDLTEDVLFGDVWERSELSKRDRSLITCAALVATGKTEQMDFHFQNAIRNGVTQAELVEMITHLAFYVGWPSAMSAVNRAKALLVDKGAS